MIYILYSDDYEVNLGGNLAQEKEIVIDTTERLLSTCKKIGIPVTLFADLACLWRYRELGFNAFPELADIQLKSAVEKGNDVQIHIHPHWLETKITHNDDGYSKYDFDMEKYLIGNWVSIEVPLQEFCYNLFKRAKLYLEDLLCSVDPNYHCIAFRAGGYGIQPNTKEIFQALIDSGYLIDSSIIPGMEIDSNVNQINFTEVPRQGNYFLSPESGLNQVAERGIFEIPILSLRNGSGRWIIAKNFPLRVITYLRNRYRNKTAGYSIQSNSKWYGARIALREIKRVFYPFWRLALMDDSTVKMMIDGVSSYIDSYYVPQHDIYFSFIMHSKQITLNQLNILEKFHATLQRKYGDELKAITFQEAVRLISLRGLFS